jgi:hypothetical protein
VLWVQYVGWEGQEIQVPPGSRRAQGRAGRRHYRWKSRQVATPSCRRPKPRHSVLTPGSPSPLRPRKPPSEACGLEIDQDLNAARNLAALAGSSPERLNASGAEGSGREDGPTKPAAVKQESPSRKPAVRAAGNEMLGGEERAYHG